MLSNEHKHEQPTENLPCGGSRKKKKKEDVYRAKMCICASVSERESV